MAETQKAEQEQQNTEPKFDICPCCGKPTLSRPVKPNQRLLDHWMACMVSGVPFTHTYPLYGGRIEITIGSLSPDTDAALSVIISMLDALARRDDLKAAMTVDMSQLRAMARMCALVHRIRVKVADGDWREYRPKDSLDMALDRLTPVRMDILAGNPIDGMPTLFKDTCELLLSSKALSAVPLDVLSAVAEVHMRLNDILMNSGFDENFWKGIELG